MWKWGFFVLMAFSITLTVACGGDDEVASEPTEARVFPTYIFSEGVYWAEGYATPDFTQPRGSIIDGVKNYAFQYQAKLVDQNKYVYEFCLTDGGRTSDGNAEIVWVTDDKYNFTMQWNDTSKEYDIISGYFAGGKLDDITKVDGAGVSVDGKSYSMLVVLHFTISFNGMRVTLGIPR